MGPGSHFSRWQADGEQGSAATLLSAPRGGIRCCSGTQRPQSCEPRTCSPLGHLPRLIGWGPCQSKPKSHTPTLKSLRPLLFGHGHLGHPLAGARLPFRCPAQSCWAPPEKSLEWSYVDALEAPAMPSFPSLLLIPPAFTPKGHRHGQHSPCPDSSPALLSTQHHPGLCFMWLPWTDSSLVSELQPLS